MAATIAARSDNCIRSSLAPSIPVLKTCLYTDSQVVLGWLKNENRLTVFVTNKVREIKTLTTGDDWIFCSTDENPADQVSRGIPSSFYLLW